MLYLLFNHKHKKGTEMQDNYTTKAKHLTIDSRRLIERWKK
ncbi:IS30 family transposase, partial [Streptococcus pneumoniae]|nr:IS30 family transposase [Streptococcus pneumoniae]